jgi:hypothetical protein
MRQVLREFVSGLRFKFAKSELVPTKARRLALALSAATSLNRLVWFRIHRNQLTIDNGINVKYGAVDFFANAG